MYKRYLPLVAVILLAVTSGKAQQYSGPCGTVGDFSEALTERLLANKERFRQSPPLQYRSTTYVPIKFHLVARNDGSGRVKEAKVMDALCALNEDFADMDIQFYLHNGFSYINNSTVYTSHANATFFMTQFRDDNALNVWIVQDATPSGNGIGTVLGYYNPAPVLDWLVVRLDEINASNATLPHEVGHFFSLVHPHNGWDAQPFVPDPVPQWAINMGYTEPTPNPVNTLSPGGVLSERQDGSNCENAGDFLCDTKPDYNGFGWPDCSFNGGAKDPSGTLIDPDEKLFMGYFLNCPRNEYYFSESQTAIVITDLLQAPSRAYLRIPPPANTATIAASPDLEYPVGGVTTEGYNIVNFRWTGVAGADSYLLEIDRAPSFTINPIRQIVSGTSVVIEDLEASKTYFWRIRPFNAYYVCSPFTATGNFKTGSTVVSTEAVSFISDWSIDPNPVRSGSELVLRINSEESFEATIQLYSPLGQLVYQWGQRRFASGDQVLGLPLDDLSAGIYILSLQTPEGRVTKRIVLTN